ncbi:hypothetical protein DFJ58DRAFT_847121 [Suillus subalutaceus]|uniref:uncharacterized protein n=1 Tax=Suillus subalutaceus TaxID=48586 RepID=UPI001B85B9D1|nr:uncharacterized protein DFJ58DRAFT_847121 [Suillus subalutaceus]KAG1836179.1 hypothetical protein DFJ58DRAFT_847121 [Suillus subalutaceus]
MSKRAWTSRWIQRTAEGDDALPPALYDAAAWDILTQFLTSSIYHEDDWVEPRRLLFSGDGNDAESLRNLKLLKVKTNGSLSSSPVRKLLMRPKATNSTSKIGEEEMESVDGHSRIRKSYKQPKTKNSFILDMAKVGDDDEEEEGEEEGEEGYGDGTSVGSVMVTRLARPLATQKLAATFDDMATRFEQNQRCSSQGCENATHGVPEARMYLVHVQRTTTEYVTSHLRKKGFPVTVSAWAAGQLYVVADSPKTVAKSLPLSLYLAVKQYTLVTEEERGAVERSQSEFPNPAWVRVKNGPYRGDTALVFEQLPNGIVAILIVSRDMPYAMPGRTRALVEQSRLPKNKTVSDVIHDDQVLHLESGWDRIFMKETVIAFSMQFLRVGDSVRVVTGSLRGELGKVVSTDHTVGSNTVFRVGDTVRIVAGSYFGLEGHIIQMREDICHVCQYGTNEEIEVSKYYLDGRPLTHTLTSRLPTQQYFEPYESDSIQIGDYIEVQGGKHKGRHGIVDWCAKGDTDIWFKDIFTSNNVELSSISVPAAMVQQMDITKTIQYTKERGYDVRPGDVVTVVRGPEYEVKGVVQHIKVPIGFVMKKETGKEVFIISGDRKGSQGMLHSVGLETCIVAVYGQKRIELKLYEVATRYGVRLNRVMLEGPDMTSFCEMRKRSFLAPPPCSITPPVETLPSSSSASMTGPIPSSSNVWSSWSAHPGGVDAAQDPLLSIQPSSSTLQPWSVDKNDTQDSNDATAEKLRDSGPLPWLREFSSLFRKYHAMLKVSPSFDGSLSKQFVSTSCPDPFCGDNGPAPEDFVAAFCTSNGAGAAMKHYHIPARYLSPAPPRKKNQECLILDGPHRGLIRTLVSCSAKHANVKINIMPTAAVTLRKFSLTSLGDLATAERELVMVDCLFAQSSLSRKWTVETRMYGLKLPVPYVGGASQLYRGVG